jgi:hypothetical protein
VVGADQSAQLVRFFERGDGQAGRATVDGRTRHWNRAVAVAAGFDDREEM